MQHLDTDIDLALDDPDPARPGPLHHAARVALALALLAVFAAALTGRLTLDGKLMPAAFALVAILTAVTSATRPN